MKVSDVMLERFALDELPAGHAARVKDALANDALLRDRLQSLTASNEREALLGLAREVRTRLDAPPSRPRLAWWPVPAAIAVVVAVLVWQPSGPAQEGPDRIKGPDATLAIYRQTPSGSEQLDERAVAHAGDVIRIGYRLSSDAFGAIVSVDGRGTVTVHHPDNAATAAPMNGGETILLAHAYELDDAPRWERFYIITGTTPFPIDAIVRAAKHAPPTLELTPGMTQSTFLLQKDSTP